MADVEKPESSAVPPATVEDAVEQPVEELPAPTAEQPTAPEPEAELVVAEGGEEIQPSEPSAPEPGEPSAPAEPGEDLASEPALTAGLEGEGESLPAGDEEGALEELILPSLAQALEPLAPGTTLGPSGQLQVHEPIDAQGQVNRYRTLWNENPAAPVEVELREAPADEPGLQREAEVLTAVQYGMLPRLVASFEEGGRRYLALERLDGPTLEAALSKGVTTVQAVSAILQLAQVLRRLQRASWAVPGLSPQDILLGQPLRLTDLSSATRIGEAPSQPWYIAGYSAPELVYGGAVSGKEAVYTLGALLYRALAGTTLPEEGVELLMLSTAVPVPGAPQLLSLALAPADERIDLETFYQGLLAFKSRLARADLNLEIASGTTIGLNPTRPVNEDACGFAAWSLADDSGVRQRAVLCMVDGMGGMEAGEVASQTALSAVLQAATQATNGTPQVASGQATVPQEVLAGGPTRPGLDPVRLVQQAAVEVHEAAAGRSVGATITLGVVEDGYLSLAHVGDTRAYLLRDGALQQITRDHSLVAAMVASGVLTKEQARHHPESNKVLRSLGSQAVLPESYIDTLQPVLGEGRLRLQPSDVLFFCSDGVWGNVEDDQLATILGEAMDGPTAVDVILREVLASGASDNASVIIARCRPQPSN